MTPKLTYFGRVDSGKLILTNRARFDQELPLFEGKRVEITVQKAKRRRSLQQNRYLFGCVYVCALQGLKDAGFQDLTVEDVHEFMKMRFLPGGKEIVSPETGEVVTIARSTSTLSTTEMMSYIEQIAQFCAEFLNTAIPEPLEQTEMNL